MRYLFGMLFATIIITGCSVSTTEEEGGVNAQVEGARDVSAENSDDDITKSGDEFLMDENADTIGWNAYTNEEFGLQFMYPSTYTVEQSWGPGIFETPCANRSDKNGQCESPFNLSIMDNSQSVVTNVLQLTITTNRSDSVNQIDQDLNVVENIEASETVFKRTLTPTDVVPGCTSIIYSDDVMYSALTMTIDHQDYTVENGKCNYENLEDSVRSVIKSIKVSAI